MNPFVQLHQDKISGVLSCFDRVVITGTLPDISYAGAMASYLSYHKIRLFDYPRWAEPLRDELRNHAEHLALKAGIEIEFIRRYKAFRKEDRIKAIIADRGDHPGLVHIFSAMESCTFQDITGQRVTRVIKSMKFVEERVNAMIDLWGRDDIEGMGFDLPDTKPTGDEALLNGPQIPGEEISQDEIDKLFA